MNKHFKTLLLLSSTLLSAGVIGASVAEAQTNYVQATVGQTPPTVNVGTLTDKCVYSGITSLALGQAIPIPCTSSGSLAIAGAFSVSGFTPNFNFATLTATGASASVALPAGASVKFQNTGAVAVSCTMGVGSATATANELIVQPGAQIVVNAGTNTFGACIDQTGTTSNLVVLAGGSGLGNDTGGGGGGSGGGSVTQGTSPWVDSITQWGGGTLGAPSNYGTSPGAVVVPGVNAFITNAPTVTVGNSITLGAGTNSVGNIGTIGNIGTLPAVNQGTSPWVIGGTVTNVPSGTQTVAGFAGDIVQSVTRAANTTVYTANTGWNVSATGSLATGYFTFSGICPAAAKSVLIPQIGIGSSADPATKLAGNLFLFNTAPATLIADNATFTIAAGDWANLTAGSKSGIPFTLTNPTGNSGNPNSGVALTGLNVMAVCNSGTAAIYGVVEVTNAYTPASGEVLTIDISMIGQN